MYRAIRRELQVVYTPHGDLRTLKKEIGEKVKKVP
jgi:hypothetical protein